MLLCFVCFVSASPFFFLCLLNSSTFTTHWSPYFRGIQSVVCRGYVRSCSSYPVPAPPLPARHDLKKSCFVPSHMTEANQHLTCKLLYILYILDPSCNSAIHPLRDLSLGPLNVWLFEMQPLHVQPTPGLPPTKKTKHSSMSELQSDNLDARYSKSIMHHALSHLQSLFKRCFKFQDFGESFQVQALVSLLLLSDGGDMGKSLQALLMAGTGQFECSTRHSKKKESLERKGHWDSLINVLIRCPKLTTIKKVTAMFGVNWRPTSSQHRLRPEVGTQRASLDLSLMSLWKGLDQNEQEWPQLMDLRRGPEGLLLPSVLCSKCVHCMAIRPSGHAAFP